MSSGRLIKYWVLLYFFIPGINYAQDDPLLIQQAEEIDWLVIRGQHELALVKADSILNDFDDKNIPPAYYPIVYCKGKSLEYLYKYVESIEIFNDLLPKSIEAKDFETEAKIYLSLARIYDNLDWKQELKANLILAADLIAKRKLTTLLCEYSVRKASYHRYLGEMDSCINYANKGIEYADLYKNAKTLPDCYLLLGIATDEKTEKIRFFKKAVELYMSMGNLQSAAYQYMNVAKNYFALDNFTETKSYLDSAAHCLNSIVDSNGEKNILHDLRYPYQKLLGEYYYRTDQPDSAAHYYRLSSLSRDSAQLITLKLNVAKNEVEIAVLKEKEENIQLKATSNYLIFGLISVSAISVLLWFFLRKNTRNNEIIKRNNELILDQNNELEGLFQHQKKLLSEVHHRVKNNLQLVISLMTIKGNSIGDEVFKEAMDDLSSKVQSMSLIHEQLYKVGEFSTIHLKTYLTNIIDYFKDILSDERPIEIISDIDDSIKLNLETTLPLGIIIVELIQNSIKHAKPHQEELKIEIKLNQSGETYEFNFRDNGIRFDTVKKGLGTMLIENMGRQLNGESGNKTESGFSYRLKFKEKTISPIKFENN